MNAKPDPKAAKGQSRQKAITPPEQVAQATPPEQEVQATPPEQVAQAAQPEQEAQTAQPEQGGGNADGRRTATVASRIKHDGKSYAVSDPILLTRDQFEELQPAGALVEASWESCAHQ